MLVLSRKLDESVVIDDRIEVQVVEIRGDKVRLGFTADAGIKIHRKEVWLAIQDQQATHIGNVDSPQHG